MIASIVRPIGTNPSSTSSIDFHYVGPEASGTQPSAIRIGDKVNVATPNAVVGSLSVSRSANSHTANGKHGEIQKSASQVIDLDDTSDDEPPDLVNESSDEEYIGGYNYGGDLTDSDSGSICSNDERLFDSEQESIEENVEDVNDIEVHNQAPILERAAIPINTATILMPEELDDIAASAVRPRNQKKLKEFQNNAKATNSTMNTAEQHAEKLPTPAATATVQSNAHREKEASMGDQLNPLIAWYSLVAKPITRKLWPSMRRAQKSVDTEWEKLRECDNG